MNSSAACILQTSLHGSIQLHFLVQLVQDVAAERGKFQNQDYWSVRNDGQPEICVQTAGCVAACLKSGTKYRHSEVVSCIFVCKLHVDQLFVCLSLWNGEQINSLFVAAILKISGVSRQRRKIITLRVVWKKRLSCFINWYNYELVSMPHLFPLSFRMRKQSCGEFIYTLLN